MLFNETGDQTRQSVRSNPPRHVWSAGETRPILQHVGRQAQAPYKAASPREHDTRGSKLGKAGKKHKGEASAISAHRAPEKNGSRSVCEQQYRTTSVYNRSIAHAWGRPSASRPSGQMWGARSGAPERRPKTRLPRPRPTTCAFSVVKLLHPHLLLPERAPNKERSHANAQVVGAAERFSARPAAQELARLAREQHRHTLKGPVLQREQDVPRERVVGVVIDALPPLRPTSAETHIEPCTHVLPCCANACRRLAMRMLAAKLLPMGSEMLRNERIEDHGAWHAATSGGQLQILEERTGQPSSPTTHAPRLDLVIHNLATEPRQP